MTQSLLQDVDFDLRNNYEQLDYLAYYPERIPDPHVMAVGTAWYPVHGIGLPILIAPFFGMGGRLAVVIMMVMSSVAGIRVLWSVLLQAGMGTKATFSATLIAGFTLPLASLSGQIFPEIPAFLLVALALAAIVSPMLTGWHSLVFSCSVTFLPWLHPKYALVSMALLLGAALVHGHIREVPGLRMASGMFLASGVSLILLTYHWYGIPLPGAPILMAQPPFEEHWLNPLIGNFFVRPWVGMTGILFDQQSGLLMASPVFMLAVPGFVVLWHRTRKLALVCGMIFLSVYLPAGLFGIWYGGFSSPARLLTPAIPALALSLASLLGMEKQRVWNVFAVLAVPSLVHAYLMVTLPSYTRYGDPVSQHNYFIGLIERMTHVDLTLFFPSFRSITAMTWFTTGIYVLTIVIITILLTSHKSAEYSNKTQPVSPIIYE